MAAAFNLSLIVVLSNEGFAWQETEATTKSIDFALNVRPILDKYCIACHGSKKQEGGLRLDTKAGAMRGGDNFAPALVANDPDSSSLYRFIADPDADLQMPPKGDNPTPVELDVLRQWIEQGAAWPDDTETVEEKSIHWSFQPVSASELDENQQAWIDRRRARGAELALWDTRLTPATQALRSRSLELDAMIVSKLAENQLQLSPTADRVTLIRRLHLVMLGLPPTPDQIERFVKDDSPEAWPELVESVLNSPHYGERWAQHWLDVVRFGETNGFETNRERTTAWHYRDYVVQAFHDDKPYDQFVREQIAGDVFGNDLGTGFLVAGPYDLVKSQDKNLTLMQRQDELTDMINATGTVFIGLTVGCAKCHNHKFDPITQTDFYALQAVLSGVQHGERPLPLATDRQKKLDELNRIIAERQESLSQFQPIAQPEFAVPANSEALSQVKYPRDKVNAQTNVDRVRAVKARFVRFSIERTNGGQPCIDELRVISKGRNVGLASLGAKASCSSELPGYAIHKLEHIHDGLSGNNHSWIANEERAWVQLELAESTEIDRIEWARDATAQFNDRVAIEYKIEAALEPDQWQLIASSTDRVPFDIADSASRLAPLSSDDVSPKAAASAARWRSELEDARKERSKLETSATAYIGRFEQPGPTFRLFRGEPMQPKEQVAPNTIRILGELGLTDESTEQERRKALANWLASDLNPLTARVYVNRIWQYHFGRGIVDTPNDFGANGSQPTHPELLDWLAMQLMTNGWSTKHIHRLILLSDAWMQSNEPRADGMRIDADSRLLWRFPTRRLEAEGIRDSMLSVAGQLDLSVGGPGFDGFEVEMENVRHYFPKKSFTARDFRRMLYMTKVRMEREATFGVFDCPDASQAVARRIQSTTPLQALNLMNSPFVLLQSENLATRLRAKSTDTNEQVRYAYQLCYGRAPHESELADCQSFIDQHSLVQFCRAILNTNEFLFIP